MLRRTEGIVLRSTPHGEADLIVTFLTSDLGVAGAFAKSPRKTKSRFGSSLEPLTRSVISLLGREDAPLPRLTQADIIEPHQALREDYRCFVSASELLELTLVVMPEGKPNPEAYALLRDVLGLLEEGCAPLYAILYKIRLLRLKGYAPALGGCARCGGEAGSFFASEGGMLCDACAARPGPHRAGGVVRVSRGSARLYEALGEWEIGKAGRLKASQAMLAELTAVIDAHVGHAFSRRLKTREAR